MPINGVCPDCGHKFPLQHALADVEARQALASALAMPASLARLVVPYISLMAPPGKAVQMPKLARLLAELVDMVNSEKVTRQGASRVAPVAIWQQGIEDVLSNRDAGGLVQPLKGHAYLSEIVFRLATKGAGRIERQREQQQRHKLHQENPGMGHLEKLIQTAHEKTAAAQQKTAAPAKERSNKMQAPRPNPVAGRDGFRSIKATLKGVIKDDAE